ncbi:formimidoylglutamate deiminase [Marinicella gelatinilytica]|uniref:formimidoylglutamate deiminase n=1 Tax=Marinicella gelatinilytica TaxID=2996017 RepID=UPI002260F92E|nr:formimidoylglutamate deiminase [Marinicella gelatinilytica]MCX7544171.1 formimidoylglutamate deiminase [Marinicella gelatinilytica]
MTNYFFHQALIPKGWAKNVRVVVENDLIQSVDCDVSAEPGDKKASVVIPAVPNIHSHVFQRAMAGCSEYRLREDDDFWSWRELMYKLANAMDVNAFYDIAKSTFQTMKDRGYANVCEFHYVHRDLNDPNNTHAQAEAILQAADDVGLPITLLPVLYSYSGFGEQPLLEEQQRFALTVDEYLQLYAHLEKQIKPQQRLGICFHSLRAVSPEQMRRLLDALPKEAPVHIHIAEQTAEVDQCRALYGQTPVAWLLDNFEVNEHWCLIHATHLTEQESKDLAQSGAIAGLCPLTEANLGDGIFPLENYKNNRGRWAIGSDSNVKINPAEELQMLAYSQRLSLRKRVVCSDQSQAHAGSWLWQQAVAGGVQASGQKVAGIVKGHMPAFLALKSINQADQSRDHAEILLDRLVFADDVGIERID